MTKGCAASFCKIKLLLHEFSGNSFMSATKIKRLIEHLEQHTEKYYSSNIIAFFFQINMFFSE